MDVFSLRDRVVSEYGEYVSSFLEIQDPRIRAFVDEQLAAGALWPEPLVQLNPAFQAGGTVDDLVSAGLLHPECSRIFRDKTRDGELRDPLQLHRHQVEAIRSAREGRNYVLTTGTGSGKSLSYIVPAVDHVLREGSGKGIRAIVVYPMNALANSQLGELEKFLTFGYPRGRPPVTFRRYTGQERSEERRDIIANPPDILLTNYVMLELLLTRVHERELIAAASHLRFLVLDELHTYRGRQGADVAMLVRRVRAACRATNLQHVGTSATMSGSGSWTAQQRDVAEVATRVFGAPVRPEDVIGETLRRLTPARDDGAGFVHELQDAIAGRRDPPDDVADRFAAHPLAVWIESRLGLEELEGRLVRRQPRPLAGPTGAAAALAADVGLPTADCEAALRRALLAGYRARDARGRPAFAFRLHQFVSKGDAVYASPEPEAERHLTLRQQQFVPNSDRKRVLLPLAFCRECGKEYYLVRRVRGDDGRFQYHPRDIGDRDDDGGEPGFLHIDTTTPWPDAGDEVLSRLPETWLEQDARGRLRVRAARRADVPRTIFVGADGVEGGGNVRAQWLGAPFRFCPSCRVAYSGQARSDFGKLATLGSEGRSTATTVMTLGAVRALRRDGDLPGEARKLLSFTDNRQDASLQAGHFNDFVEIVQLRAALWQAVHAGGAEGLRHDALTRAVFDALALPLPVYAANPAVEFLQREETERALRRVLGYYLYRDLERGWRLTSPNLEQCGLLAIDYLSLRELCGSERHWTSRHAVLSGATPDERERACRVLLDYMRRELAIRVEYLEAAEQESILQLSTQYLVAPWSLDPEQTMRRATSIVPGSRDDEAADDRLVHLSARGGFGSYLRSRTAFPSHRGQPLSVDDSGEMIDDLLEVLTTPGGIVHRGRDTRDGRPTYQLNASAIVWREGTGARAFHDPVRVPSAPEDGLRPNPFFREFYRAGVVDLRGLEAREHTAQVPGQVRLQREERFRNATLPILFCSPTMELGVDIASLNVVNLRNVPPTPANYAQRSGRAGRSGQPAFVFTYCSAGSPHDQYFFRFPERMVSGAVTTPRLDLANEDLVRAHVHAIWLGVARIDLRRSLAEVLDVSGDEPTLQVLPAIHLALHDRRHRDAAAAIATEVLSEAVAPLLAPGETVAGWVARVVEALPRSFEEACERWCALYRAALGQSKRQQRIVLDAARAPADRERAMRLRREAEAQLRLLLEVSDEDSHSDFYSYRYFASEGFLPGYNFPRLPLSAFLPGRRGSDSRDDFLSRPRFLAISEFGPRTILYHEGSRYQVTKVILPIDAERADVTRRAAQCGACGYLHPLGDEPAPDLCEHCGEALPQPFDNLFRMQNVSTRRRDRISSDEEERLRVGFELRTGVRFAQRAGVISAQHARVVGEDGTGLATLMYGGSATLWRLNIGERRRSNPAQTGFLLDVERGVWTTDGDDDGGAARHARRVVPYVEDRRNCLVLAPESDRPLSAAEMASLQAALKAAIQVEHQLEDRELAAEPLPAEDDRRSILLYESAEGGAGVLRRLVEDPGALARVARVALELCHFDPATLADQRRAPRATEDCEAACYDCLLSYYNQRDHRLLDRMLLPRLLAAWAAAHVEASPRPLPREEQLDRLRRLCQSDLERRWLAFFEEQDLRLPSSAQSPVGEGVARADFLYARESVAVFVDGPVHDTPEQQTRDRAVDDAAADLGYSVVRFRHDADWRAIVARYPGVFGRAREEPRASTPPASQEVNGLDLDLFEPAWSPLVERLAAEPGVLVEAAGDVADSAGRVFAFAHARVSRGGRTVVLLDEADAASKAAVGAALGPEVSVLTIDPRKDGAMRAVLTALEAGR